VPSPQACTRTSKQAYSHLSLNLLQSRTKAQSVLNREIMKTFFELPPPRPHPPTFSSVLGIQTIASCMLEEPLEPCLQPFGLHLSFYEIGSQYFCQGRPRSCHPPACVS
jgi:hypothetical protein